MVKEIESLRASQDCPDQKTDADNAAAAARSEVARLEAVCDELNRKLAAAEKQLGSADAPAKQQGKLYEMQRRFELAVDDVRELKRRNADLESRLSDARPGSRGGAVMIPGGLDWDTQKRRLLASLEAEVDEDDEDRQAERLSIESTISITDQVVAEKDREIGELKQLLHDQSSNLGSVAVGATAIAGILDQDELVRQEREKLLQLQTDWQQKLRQAEVDISLERAKIARDRAEVEEKLAVYQADMADRRAAGPAAVEGAAHGKPIRGRWLARLGLKDLDE
jgi:chromosome segregation ATPase